MQRTKKFEKICLLAVIVLLIVAMLTACNDKDNQEEELTNNGGITTSYDAPTPSNITVDDVKAVIVPIMKEYADEFGLSAEEIDEEAEDEDVLEEAKMILEKIVRPAGITRDMLETTAGAIKPLIKDYALPIYKEVEEMAEDDDVDTEEALTEIVDEFVKSEDIRTIENGVVAAISPYSANNLLALAVGVIDYYESMSYSYRGGYYGEDESIYLFETQKTEAEVEAILTASNVDVALWKNMKDGGSNPLIGMVKSLIQSDDAAYTLSAILSSLKSAFNYNADEQKALIDLGIEIGFAAEDGIENIVTGESVSYKDLVKAVNIIGNILNAGLNGLGDKQTYHDRADSVISKILNLTGGAYELYPIRAVTYPEAIGMVANLCAGLTAADVTNIYMDYDDMTKAKTENAGNVKKGRLVAAVVNLVSGEYSKLSSYTLNFINNACTVYSVPVDIAGAIVDLVAAVGGKNAEEMTDAECKAVYTIVENVMKGNNDKNNFYIYGSADLVLKADASKAEIIEAIGNNYSYEDKDGNELSLDRLNFSLRNVDGVDLLIVSGDNINTTSTPVFILDDGCKQYVNVDSYRYYHPQYTFVELSARTDKDALIRALGRNSYGYGSDNLYIDSRYYPYVYIYNPSTFKMNSTQVGGYNADEIDVSGYDTTKKGARAAVVSYNSAYGTFQAPLFYYVYDNANPEMTGISAYADNSYVPVGATVDKLGLRVRLTYNYGRYYSYGSDDRLNEGDYTVSGFDSSTETDGYNYRYLTITYRDAATGKTYTCRRSYRVYDLSSGKYEMNGIEVETGNYYLQIGDTLDALELTVYPEYYDLWDAYVEPLTAREYTVENFDTSEYGNHYVTVRCGRFTDEIWYYVEDDEDY